MDQHARGGATRWPARRKAPRHHSGETKASGVVVRSPMPVLSLAVRQPATATGLPPRGSKPRRQQPPGLLDGRLFFAVNELFINFTTRSNSTVWIR